MIWELFLLYTTIVESGGWGFLSGMFYVFFGYLFMVFGSLGARASQSVSQSVSQSANRAVSQSVGQPTSGQAVSQSVVQR